MTVTPDIDKLSFIVRKGVKYFELTAEPVKRELLKGVFIEAWGYNGTSPGPTIEVYPGDYICIRVYNNLPEPTSLNFHGLDISNIMDGVPDVGSTPEIEPGRYFDYNFKVVNPPGTHMYHTHYNSQVQEMMGLQGGFIILEPEQYLANIQKDFFIMLQEFKVIGLDKGDVKSGVYSIDPLSEDFNFFAMNGKCFPDTSPLEVRYGETVQIRLANAMAGSHPIHLHGHQFTVRACDGNSISNYDVNVRNTILVASGETWDIRFNANNPGIWPFHCNIPRHMSNNFTKTSGGMFTVISYRENT